MEGIGTTIGIEHGEREWLQNDSTTNRLLGVGKEMWGRALWGESTKKSDRLLTG